MSTIEDVIGEYVNLQRSGGKLYGFCPFHEERFPSFTVDPWRQTFRCFGCGVQGTAHDFASLIEDDDRARNSG